MAAKKRASQSGPSGKPTTPSVLTAPPLSTIPIGPQKPHYRVRKLGLFEKTWIWYESSFAISMLEPWEKILIHTFALALLTLLYFAGTRYLPAQMLRVAGRAKFYLYGGPDGDSVSRLVAL